MSAASTAPSGPPPVPLTDDGRDYTLANGIVTAKISKASGAVMSLRYHDLELLDTRYNDAQGNFTIPNIRPGTYTFHAFANGLLGEFDQTNITVGPY